MRSSSSSLLLLLLQLQLLLRSARAYAAGYDRCAWPNHGSNLQGSAGGWALSLRLSATGAAAASYVPGAVYTVTLAGSSSAGKGFVRRLGRR